MSFYVDPDIKNTERIFPMQGRGEYLRLDMNESVCGLPGDFVEEVLGEVTSSFLATYPEPDRFLKAYSDYKKVPFDGLMVTNGTDMAIRYILETFGEKGKEVLTVTPTFEMYRINCLILGLRHVAVPYDKSLSIDTDDIVAAIGKDTRIVVLINPNNPIGDTYTGEQARLIFDRAAEAGAIVVVDEAYHYFCDESLLDIASEYENVLVLRTFSKLMALAALRLGVVVGSPELIGYLKHGKLTFDVNSLALLFGERLLGRPDIIDQMIATEREGKRYLVSRLDESGYEFKECKGNYVLIKSKSDSHVLTNRLQDEKKILVHDYNNEWLKDYIRVSTADIKTMRLFFEVFSKLDSV